MIEHTDKTQKPLIVRILGNPIFGSLGFVVGLIGLLYGIVTHEVRDIKLYEVPTKSRISVSSIAPKFELSFNGDPLPNGVTIAHVIIWNSGSKSARGENILRPVELSLSPQRRILEASISKSSRSDITLISLGLDEANRGTISVNWKILEKHDGADIQIIYSGTDDVKLNVAGAIEGQGDIRIVRDALKRDVGFLSLAMKTIPITIGMVIGFYGIFIGVQRITKSVAERQVAPATRIGWTTGLTPLVGGSVVAAMSLYFYFQLMTMPVLPLFGR